MRFLRSFAAFAVTPIIALTACSSNSSPQTATLLPSSLAQQNPQVAGASTASTASLGIGSSAHRALQARIRTAGLAFEKSPQTARANTQSLGNVGTSNTTTADPPVPRPRTTPCVVSLFSGVQFADFTPKPFQFAPPAACPGPWSKVVFELDLGVTAGRQFDRTAIVGFGGTTIFFGTTSEPSRTVARNWHVERDLTDESVLFTKTQSGQISIGNVVDSTYTGVLSGAAQLDFYPASEDAPAPRVADVVVPIADPIGNAIDLQTPSDLAATSFTPPRTVVRAVLDVIAQSQSGDEFWYTCFPNDLATLLNNCGSTAFRESDVTVDGKPAGVAPVYPWIYTGGIDPYLWRPIPGVQTLSFVPYRVDLTPFAGTFDDGASHRVAISVFNANHYFAVTGTLLLYLDHDASKPLTGGLDADDASAAPPENVVEGGAFDSSGIGKGTIDTTSQRSLHVRGHVDTSHGTIATDVAQTIAFTQHQDITSATTQFVQNITQDTKIESTSTSHRARDGGGDEHGDGGARNRDDFGRFGDGASASTTRFEWPLTLDFASNVNADGTQAQTTTVDQRYLATYFGLGENGIRSISDIVTTADTLNFDATGALTSTTGNASTQTFRAFGGGYGCYGRKVASSAGVVTSNAPASCFGDDEPHR